jgi:hypothetical protein
MKPAISYTSAAAPLAAKSATSARWTRSSVPSAAAGVGGTGATDRPARYGRRCGMVTSRRGAGRDRTHLIATDKVLDVTL